MALSAEMDSLGMKESSGFSPPASSAGFLFRAASGDSLAVCAVDFGSVPSGPDVGSAFAVPMDVRIDNNIKQVSRIPHHVRLGLRAPCPHPVPPPRDDGEGTQPDPRA